MTTFWVWGLALVLYAGFLGWYQNWRGPLKPAEVEALVETMRANSTEATDRNSLDAIKAFFLADDGREFFMLNLVRLAPGDIPDPETGQPRPAREVMAGYTRMFLPALFARGGHPAIAARKIGPFVDTWGVPADPDWTMIGYMRYRSRRDLAHLVCDPRFNGAHEFKFAAMPQTASFPTRPMMMFLPSPRIWVGLAIALAAALAQIALLLGAAA